MNNVTLSGNLCKDPELRKTNSGKSVISISIGVSRDMKDADGNYLSDFIDIVVWEKSAEYLSKYGHKGDLIECAGRLQTRTYQDKNGQNRNVVEVQVQNIKVLTKTPSKPDNAPQSNNSKAIEIQEDDLPF